MTQPFRAALLFLSVLFVTAIFSGCGSSTSTATNVTTPDTVRCQPTVTPSATTYGPAGGTGTLNITVARECAWTAATDAPWLAITSAREGQGDGSVAYRVDTNADPVTRRGALRVSDARVELTQDAAPCRYQVTASTEPAPGEGGERAIDVRTHAACNWTATATVPWIAIAPASGRGNAAVRVSFTANDGPTRSGDAIVATQRIALTQLARALPPPPLPTPPAPAPTPTPPGPSPTPVPAPAPAPAPQPTPGARIDLKGRVSSLAGTCSALTFQVDRQSVWTTSETNFRKGSCGDIRNGTEVDIEGRRMSDGTVRADRIEIKRD